MFRLCVFPPLDQELLELRQWVMLVSAAPVSITGFGIYGRCPLEMYQVNEWLPWGVIRINRELGGQGQEKGEPSSKGGEKWQEGLSFRQLRTF